MSHHPHPLLLLLWAAWILQAWLASVLVRKFARRFERRRRLKFENYRPRAMVIVPFKGIDADLPGCVRALCEQDYPQYELLLVVESADDPAHDVLTSQLRAFPDRQVQVVVAGEAPAHIGQKLHNQLAAIERIDPRCVDDDVWVFADSDAVPSNQWLAALVGPLVDKRVTGATTGYRWLVPVNHGAGAFWSRYASVLNGSSASFLAFRRLAHAWGGSMAMRAETARRGDLAGRLSRSLSDDYSVSRLCADLKLRVYFVARCLVPTPIDMGWLEVVTFARRQCVITRVYAPKLFWAALATASIFVAGFFSAAAHTLAWIGRAPSGSTWTWSAGACAAVFLAHQVRSMHRARAVRRAFGAATAARLSAPLRIDRWLTPIWMTMHWMILLSATLGRTVIWRGVWYQLDGRDRVVRMGQEQSDGATE